MAVAGLATAPQRSSYDVVIVGGAIMGSSVAWWLTEQPDFDGSVLVVERDPSYEFCSTAHTNSCMRQQFSTELNVRISQFAADFVKNLRAYMGGDERVPELSIRSFGYLYLADTPGFAEVLRQNQQVQRAAGAATQLMTPQQIRRRCQTDAEKFVKLQTRQMRRLGTSVDWSRTTRCRSWASR